MVLIILLFTTIILQFFAAGVALRLTRTTKYNASWILITVALILMCVTMVGVFFRVFGRFSGISYPFNIPDDVSVWLSLCTSLCFAVGVFLIKKVMTYITLREEQKRKSEERVLSAVIQAEEVQRLEFSKELHDGLGPLLSTARLSISALASRTSDSLSKEIVQNAEQAIALSIKNIKDISNNLSPHILNNFGVIRALNSFINRLRPVVSTKIIFDTNLKNERFTPETEVVIYRVVCELINNSIKHSQAKIMIISINYTKPCMTIEVKDDGKGFDIENRTDGMGLSNISSRVSYIKGKIQIQSEPNSGTQVNIELPAPIVR